MHRAAKRFATQRWRTRRRASGWSTAPEVKALTACLERHGAIAEAVLDSCGAAAFADACPTIGASVGAHLRHSLEHAQCCATAVESLRSGSRTPILNYDGRERDAELERDPAYLAARSRELLNGIVDGSSVAETAPRSGPSSAQQPIVAAPYFEQYAPSREAISNAAALEIGARATRSLRLE